MRVNDWANGFVCHLNNSSDKNDVVEEFKQLLDILKENGFGNFFKDRSIPNRYKIEVILQLKDEVDYRSLAFVCVLVKENLFGLADAISLAIDRYLDKEAGYKVVDVTIPRPLDKETEETILRYVHTMAGDKTKVYYKIDKSIVGGFVIESENRMIDLSTKTRLSMLKQEVVRGKAYDTPEILNESHNKDHVFNSIEDKLTGFEDLIMERKGMKVIRATLARPINPDLQSVLESNIKKIFGNEVFIRYYTDTSIIGGIILQPEKNKIIDLSLKGKVNSFRNHLREEVLSGD